MDIYLLLLRSFYNDPALFLALLPECEFVRLVFDLDIEPLCQVSRRDDFFLCTANTPPVVIPLFVEHRLADQGIAGVWTSLLHNNMYVPPAWYLPMVGGRASAVVSSLPWGAQGGFSAVFF
jgi:hypothetical protein